MYESNRGRVLGSLYNKVEISDSVEIYRERSERNMVEQNTNVRHTRVL